MSIHDEIAHIVTTHRRPSVAQRCINSIKRQWPKAKVYVCDDSENPYKYKNAKNIVANSFDIGLSAKRNLLVQETNEPYIFLWDDDYVAYEETNLEMFYYTLKNLDGVGIVGGEWMWESGLRDRWFCGKIEPVGGTIKLRPCESRPASVETEIGEVRYHSLALLPNWFLATRSALETCPFDETLKLNEHLEYFARLSSLRNETENDKKWRKRYKRLARGKRIKEKKNGKVPVYTLTTFYGSHLFEGNKDEARKGNWIYLKEEHAEELSEKGYVSYLDEVVDERPFYLPKAKGKELGVVLIPDTTCIHTRYANRSESYDENRQRTDTFMPIQRSKIGVSERQFIQWSEYPYGEPDFSRPKESILETPEINNTWDHA